MPKRDEDIVPCDCDRGRDRKPVLLSIDPVIGPVSGGDPTHRTTIRGEHLAGVRTVKFGRANVRAEDFVSQTDTTIVLEAPIALATVPEGEAPDFPLGNAVTAKTRRHKSKALTYTYSASAGENSIKYTIIGGEDCPGTTVTLTFADSLGASRSPGTVTYTTPVNASGSFDDGNPLGLDQTIISAVFTPQVGVTSRQCFTRITRNLEIVLFIGKFALFPCQIITGLSSGVDRIECPRSYSVFGGCPGVTVTLRFTSQFGARRTPGTVSFNSPIDVRFQPFEVGFSTDPTYITVTLSNAPSVRHCYVVDYNSSAELVFRIGETPCRITEAIGVSPSNLCRDQITGEEPGRLIESSGPPVPAVGPNPGGCLPCSQKRTSGT